MLMPSIFGENLFDDFFDYPFVKNEAESNGLMKTDVKDTEHGYEITMNLPGVKKEDVKAALKDGYLTISATSDSKKEEKMIKDSTSVVNVTLVPAAEAFMLVPR